MNAVIPPARTFTTVWVSLDPVQKRMLADKATSSKAYLSQIAHGARTPSVRMIRLLMQADDRIHHGMFI